MAPLHRYAIGIGSNRWHGRHGAPERVIAAALVRLAAERVRIVARAPTIATAPLGSGGRRYANAAALVETALAPPELLILLKRIERGFGRRRGRRWGPRVLDLDVLLWSGGAWRAPALTIPHRQIASRRFVLEPLATIAPRWRLPSGASVRQLAARLTRPRPVHKSRGTVGL